MAFILNSGNNNSAKSAVVKVSPLVARMNELSNDHFLMVRFNIAGFESYGKATKSDATKSYKVMLTSNKGSIMHRQKDDQVFMQVRAHGLLCWNPGKSQWVLPPAATKDPTTGIEKPHPKSKITGIYAPMATTIKLAMEQNYEQLKEEFGDVNLEELFKTITLASLWDEEFNFDLPISKEDCLELRDELLEMRESKGDSRKLMASMVVACRLTADLGEDANGNTSFIFKLKAHEILSVSEPVADLPSESGELITREVYQLAFDEADAAEEANDPAFGKLLAVAAYNYVKAGQSPKAKKRAAKKEAFRKELQAKTEGTSASVKLPTSSTLATAGMDDEEKVTTPAPSTVVTTTPINSLSDLMSDII